jgi:hypothetical protein
MYAQVAGRTNDSAGDGTTTAAVLAQRMIHFGLQVGVCVRVCVCGVCACKYVLGVFAWVCVSFNEHALHGCVYALNLCVRLCVSVHGVNMCSTNVQSAHTRLYSVAVAQSVTAGANPINVKKGIDKACDYLVAQLKEVAKPIKGREDIKVRCCPCIIACVCCCVAGCMCVCVCYVSRSKKRSSKCVSQSVFPLATITTMNCLCCRDGSAVHVLYPCVPTPVAAHT